MTSVSGVTPESARKMLSLVLQRLARVGQMEVARQLRVSETKISRVVNSDLAQLCHLLTVLDLKLVPTEMKCFPPRKIEILMELARDHLNQMEDVEQLTWGPSAL